MRRQQKIFSPVRFSDKKRRKKIFSRYFSLDLTINLIKCQAFLLKKFGEKH